MDMGHLNNFRNVTVFPNFEKMFDQNSSEYQLYTGNLITCAPANY